MSISASRNTGARRISPASEYGAFTFSLFTKTGTEQLYILMLAETVASVVMESHQPVTSLFHFIQAIAWNAVLGKPKAFSAGGWSGEPPCFEHLTAS